MAKSNVIPTRIKKRRTFLRVSGQGMKFVLPSMVVQALKTEENSIRFGFTVTKKLGCAVVRNRIRRRLREVVRLSDDLESLIGFDVVVIGRHAAEDRDFKKMRQDFHLAVLQILERKMLKEQNRIQNKKQVSSKKQDGIGKEATSFPSGCGCGDKAVKFPEDIKEQESSQKNMIDTDSLRSLSKG